MIQLCAAPSRSLSGTISVPGDKSISHRALILGALTAGTTRISGLLESEDVFCTISALRALGAKIEKFNEKSWHVAGCGVGGLSEPQGVLNLGNSGTGVRLLMGVAAMHNFTTFFTGDTSLVKRPMTRVITPLTQMGATIQGRENGFLPLSVAGKQSLMPIHYDLPLPSAQVKSAILIGGLAAQGTSTIIESYPSRDHTERLLKRFGAEILITNNTNGSNNIILVGEQELEATDISIPGDPSSAAFIIVAALTTPKSEITIRGVGMNHHRIGLFESLKKMGGDLTFSNEDDIDGELVADITVRSGPLNGITVPAEHAPSMIDEYPALAVAAASANGRTRLEGLGELRLKESNRLAAIETALNECGVRTTVDMDTLVIEGQAGPPNGGGTILAPHDHRIAMAAIVLGLGAKNPVNVGGCESIETSFPGFKDLFVELGATLESQ